MKKLLLLFLIPLCGCIAGYNIHHLHGNGNGTFYYNGIPVTGNVSIDSWTCVGFDGGKCPINVPSNEVTVNVIDNRSTGNTTT